VGTDKRPLTAHGLHDATADEAVILQMWGRWPSALIGVATGRVSGVIALDIDVRPSGSGFDSLADLGLVVPDAPTARTPSGGLHFFFQAPNYNVRNSASKIGPLVDVRGDGGYIIVPPGPGRSWDPIKNLDTTPLPPMPDWLLEHRVTKPTPPPPRPSKPSGQLSAYGEAALDNAVRRIISAGSGEQEVTLNTETYCIGTLVGGGEIPESLGLDAMQWAARKMHSFDGYRPWRAAALETKVRKAFDDGMASPKAAPND
jgi:putative DNA primase/helicase